MEFLTSYADLNLEKTIFFRRGFKKKVGSYPSLSVYKEWHWCRVVSSGSLCVLLGGCCWRRLIKYNSWRAFCHVGTQQRTPAGPHNGSNRTSCRWGQQSNGPRKEQPRRLGQQRRGNSSSHTLFLHAATLSTLSHIDVVSITKNDLMNTVICHETNHICPKRRVKHFSGYFLVVVVKVVRGWHLFGSREGIHGQLVQRYLVVALGGNVFVQSNRQGNDVIFGKGCQ